MKDGAWLVVVLSLISVLAIVLINRLGLRAQPPPPPPNQSDSAGYKRGA